MPTYVYPINNTLAKPPVELSFKVGGVELQDKLKGLTVNLPFDGQASLNSTFLNYNGDITADYPFLATPANVLGLHHHNRGLLDNAITNNVPIVNQGSIVAGVSGVVQVGISSLGMTSSAMPLFLGGGWQDNTPEGSWPAYDYTYFLDIENQFMDDIVATSPAQMNHKTVEKIAARFGVSSVDLRYEDRRVAQLRRSSGTPRSWIAKLRKPSQSAMRFRGQTLVLEPFKMITPGSGAPWIFRAGINFSEFSWTEAEPPPKNRFVINRLQAQKGIIGRKNCTGGACPGRTVNIPLSPPSSYVRMNIQCDDGRIHSWSFVDESGVYHIGGVNGSYQGPPAVQAIATYEPNFHVDLGVAGVAIVDAPTPGYRIVAYGGEENDAADQPFQHFFNDPVTQARYGVWQDYTNIEDTIVYSAADLLAYGQAVLLESTRKVYRGILKTPFTNPVIEPAQWIRLFAPLSGFDDTYWFIEHVKHVMTGPSWAMELTLSKGLW